MGTRAREISISRLAEQLGCRFEGDGAYRVSGAAALDDAGPRDLGFLRSKKWLGDLESSRVGALVAAPGVDVGDRPAIRSPNPGLHFGRALAILFPKSTPEPGVHPIAYVDPDASVDPTAHVGAFCSLAAGCVVGPRSVLHPQVTLYPGARVGADCTLHASVVLREEVQIGDRVVLHGCVVLGGDGFGFAFEEEGGWERTPHVGGLVVEDDVEIGANSAIDRAVLGETRIGRGTKIDGHVFIGHNCKLGEHVVMCGQAALAGSVTLERRVIFMAGAGSTGHVTIGEGAFVGGKAGITDDVAAGARVWGVPEMEEKSWLRSSMHFARLPDMAKRLRAIEKHLGLRKFKKESGESS
jgi:UDP-3-O-[3-hydroxymyristoyl] glucosamine N-acyltransferase